MKKFATFQVYFCLILTVVLLLNSYENAEAFAVRSRTAGRKTRRGSRRELYKNSEVKLFFAYIKEFLVILRQFRIISEDLQMLPKIPEDYRRFPKTNEE
ncbi:unnamed protein product, partial [Porites evermanni]